MDTIASQNIPQFPIFKKLSIDDKSIIDKYFSRFTVPYSDFYFFSLFTWDVNNETEYSILNDNLVIKLSDYESLEPTYSFLGSNEPLNTLKSLMQYLKEKGLPMTLPMLPKDNFSSLDLADLEKDYQITEDRDQFDYLYSVKKLSSMEGHNLYQKKKMLNQFLENYKADVEFTEIIDKKSQEEIIELNLLWERNKGKNADINNNELTAIKRCIENVSIFNLILSKVYVDKKLIGYTLFEIVNPKYTINSFQKADNRVKGIYEFINYSLVNYLKKLDVEYMNVECDLGVEGLRKAKTAYDPELIIKYVISEK